MISELNAKQVPPKYPTPTPTRSNVERGTILISSCSVHLEDVVLVCCVVVIVVLSFGNKLIQHWISFEIRSCLRERGSFNILYTTRYIC